MTERDQGNSSTERKVNNPTIKLHDEQSMSMYRLDNVPSVFLAVNTDIYSL